MYGPSACYSLHSLPRSRRNPPARRSIFVAVSASEAGAEAAAGSDDGLSGDEGGVVGEEEGGDARDLVRLACSR